MLKLITGLPGSGKTLYAVTQLKKIVDLNNLLPENERRDIYCDITGLEMDGVKKSPPLDWRDTAPNSLLIYDEAQFNKPFQPTARGLSPYDYIQELTIHRKTAHEIWYITQDPKRLHSNILEMIEQHIHLDRPFGAKLANIYQFRGVERNPKSPSAIDRAENTTKFIYDKKIFDLYESSQIDDGIKLRLPRKMLLAIALPFLIFAVTIFMFFGSGTQEFISGNENDDVKPAVVNENVSLPVPVPANVTDNELPKLQAAEHIDFYPTNIVFEKIASVISSNNKCIALDDYGEKLDISVDDCLKFVDNPYSASFIPMDVLNPVYVEESVDIESGL